ncbi:hypothetical protein ACIBM7_46855, partial [Streptomyces atratus]
MHGALGANPRKGASRTWADVHKELCDVIVTSMVALVSCTPDARKLLDDRPEDTALQGRRERGGGRLCHRRRTTRAVSSVAPA